MCNINSFEKMQVQLITMHAQNTALNYLETDQIPLRPFICPTGPIRTRSLASPNIIKHYEISVCAMPQTSQFLMEHIQHFEFRANMKKKKSF